MKAEEVHRKKLKELGYKDDEIEKLVLKFTNNCAYEFAEAYYAEMLNNKPTSILACDRCQGKPESVSNVLCNDCFSDLHGM